MATVTIRRSGQILHEPELVSAYLKGQGVIYESWGVGRLGGHLKSSYALTSDEQKAIIDLYAKEIGDLKSRQGYVTQDIVVLSDATPNLDGILDKFSREHHHTDDEVRFVVDGSGIFTLRKRDLIFDVAVTAGDLIVVPAYTRHWFELTPERKIKCIRIFKDPAGWAAIYNEPAAARVLPAQKPAGKMNFVKTLIADHQRFLVLAKELEGILSELTDSITPSVLEGLRKRFQQIIELLSSHVERKRNELFPVLRDRLPKANYWLMEMTEPQDEMLLNEVRQLHDLVSGLPSPISAEQLKKSVAQLNRWLREHVMIEEEHLFTRLQGPPENREKRQEGRQVG